MSHTYGSGNVYTTSIDESGSITSYVLRDPVDEIRFN